MSWRYLWNAVRAPFSQFLTSTVTLLIERDFLSKVPRTIACCQNFYLDIVYRDFILLHFHLVAEDLRFTRVYSHAH